MSTPIGANPSAPKAPATDASSYRESGRGRLRVGVVVDGARVPAWVKQVLTDIAESDFADLVVMLQPEGMGAAQNRLGFSELSKLLFRLYVMVDSKVFRLRRDALAMVDLPKLAGAHTLAENVEQEEIGELLEGYNLDVLLDLGAAVDTAGWASKARYGIWRLAFGEGRSDFSESALFWEIAQRNPVSQTALEVKTSPSAWSTLYRSYSKTSLTSLYRNRNATCWKTAQFVKRCLRDLDRIGAEFLETSQAECGTAQEERPPGNLQTAWFLLRQLAHLTKRSYRAMFRSEKWLISLTPRGEKESQPTLVLPPDGRFYADPFLVEKDGVDYLFFEDFLESEGRGVISCLRIDEDGATSEPQVVLDIGHHLSYPFVFEFEGQFYLMPESAACGQLRLYRATEFPYKWELESVLMDDVQAYDPTLHFDSYTEKYWLFANVKVSGGSSLDELCLFMADRPFGPWISHPQNPVVTDVQRARPAGGLFRKADALIRPSQDCSVSYGHAIKLNRITKLTETEYREEVVDQITADWMPEERARHTLNFNERFCVMDHKVSLHGGTRSDPFKRVRQRVNQGAGLERSWN